MQHEQLPQELEEHILSLIPPKILVRFRSVCKRWNTLFNDKRFITKHLGRVRPQFILLSESKVCSVDVNLDDPSIKVHNLPLDIPGYKPSKPLRVEYCDGLLIYVTYYGIGICNPWLRQIRWFRSKVNLSDLSGMGYDNSRLDNHYKMFESDHFYDTTVKASIIDFESDACKLYKFASNNWKLYKSSHYSVSLNGTLYWVAFNRESHENFIQSFDFSMERFNPYCILPSKNAGINDARALAVYREDRFSFLEQENATRNIEIWVTKQKIEKGNGESVEWMKLMSVLVPIWSSLKVSNYPPSYFINEDKSLSLVLCCYNKDKKAYIYIAKGDKFHEIKINDLVEDLPRHRAYCSSLVQVPTFAMSFRGKTHHVGSRFAFPRGVEASDEVGGNEWDDGFFDNVKNVNVKENDFGVVFVKFDYSIDNAVVTGSGHGNATAHTSGHHLINNDEYIEAIEGTYIESHITSLTFRIHKRSNTVQCGSFHGTPFVLGGGKGSKIIGFYGKSSDSYLTALGVHLSASV